MCYYRVAYYVMHMHLSDTNRSYSLTYKQIKTTLILNNFLKTM